MIRRTPVQFQFAGRGYPTLGARAAQIALGENQNWEWHKKAGVFDYSYLARSGKRVPMDEQGRVTLLLG